MKPFDDPEASRPVKSLSDERIGLLLDMFAATALEVCAAENDSLRNSRTALEEQAWRISEERDALRERLAKLKTAIRESLAAWTLAIERDAIAAPDELIEPMNDLMQLVDPEVT